MNIKPLSDRVLVEPAEAVTQTAGGIQILDLRSIPAQEVDISSLPTLAAQLLNDAIQP